jgi:protein-disulfide isomerase
MRRSLPVVVAVLAVVGLLLSLELTWVHYKVHTDPSHRSLCALGEGLDCDAVAASPSATVLGVPNALWAAFTYVLLLWLALRARRLEARPADPAPGFPAAPRAWLFWSALAVAAYTSWLVVVSFRELSTFCVFCGALWLVNAALLGVNLAGARAAAPLAGLRREWAAVRARPGDFLLLTGSLLAAAVVLVIGVPRLYPTGGAPRLSPDVRLTEADLPPDLPVRGAPGAPHLVVSLSDYRCPFCRGAHDALERARRLYPDRLRVAHVHFPLEDACNPLLDRAFHPGACRAAWAAECARLQGRFFEMHDALFERAADWTDELPLTLAAELGLDGAAFARCLADDAEVREAVRRHVALGDRLAIDGTPTLFVDGREHAGPLTTPELVELLERGVAAPPAR